WQGASLWISDATRAQGVEPRRTDFHSHHAIQVTLGLGGWFKLDTADAQVRGDVVAVAAGVQHLFGAEGLMAFLFIEPESRLGRAIGRRLFKEAELVAIPPKTLGDLLDRILAVYRAPVRNDAALVSLGRELLAKLAADAVGEEPDLRI